MFIRSIVSVVILCSVATVKAHAFIFLLLLASMKHSPTMNHSPTASKATEERNLQEQRSKLLDVAMLRYHTMLSENNEGMISLVRDFGLNVYMKEKNFYIDTTETLPDNIQEGLKRIFISRDMNGTNYIGYHDKKLLTRLTEMKNYGEVYRAASPSSIVDVKFPNNDTSQKEKDFTKVKIP